MKIDVTAAEANALRTIVAKLDGFQPAPDPVAELPSPEPGPPPEPEPIVAPAPGTKEYRDVMGVEFLGGTRRKIIKMNKNGRATLTFVCPDVPPKYVKLYIAGYSFSHNHNWWNVSDQPEVPNTDGTFYACINRPDYRSSQKERIDMVPGRRYYINLYKTSNGEPYPDSYFDLTVAQ